MKRILLIEDHEEIRQEMAFMLSKEGFEVDQASNGEDALEKLKHSFPDLIFCDLLMPRMDGKTFLAEFRRLYPRSLCQVVFLTALGDAEHIRSGMTSGADDYLVKPVEAGQLLATAHARLKKRDLMKKRLKELSEQILSALPHEIRTPLTSILGFCDITLKNPLMFSREELLEMISGIEQSSRRLYRVLENYLSYVNLKLALKDEASLKQSDPRCIVDEAEVSSFIQNLSRFPHSGACLLVSMEKAEVAMANQDFYKILEEMADNALKFSKPGTPLRIQGKISGEIYQLSIVNQGIQFSEEMQENAGIPFSQANRKKHEQQGLGLGIALVSMILKIHGGRICWKSGESDETETLLEFPLTKKGSFPQT